MVHGDDARKPARYPFELAMRLAREATRTNDAGETVRGWSGNASRWVHVGDDLLNDCKAAKSHGFRTVLVEEPGVVPYQPGGGGGGVTRGIRPGARRSSTPPRWWTRRSRPCRDCRTCSRGGEATSGSGAGDAVRGAGGGDCVAERAGADGGT